MGLFTVGGAFEIHTYLDNNYDRLLNHAQELFDWLVDFPEQRLSHPSNKDSSAFFYYPGSDRCISFTAVRPTCGIPFKIYEESNFPLLLVICPESEAEQAGWLEAELLPEYSDYELVMYALENYFDIDL